MNFKQYIKEQQEEDVVVVTNQEEWDQLDKQSGKTVHIEIAYDMDIINAGNLKVFVKDTWRHWCRVFNNTFIVVENKSKVDMCDKSTAFAKDDAKVDAWDNSKVFAEDNVHVRASDNSYVEASDNVTVESYKNSKIELRDNAKITADWR